MLKHVDKEEYKVCKNKQLFNPSRSIRSPNNMLTNSNEIIMG